jgi:hypothetical protein
MIQPPKALDAGDARNSSRQFQLASLLMFVSVVAILTALFSTDNDGRIALFVMATLAPMFVFAIIGLHTLRERLYPSQFSNWKEKLDHFSDANYNKDARDTPSNPE